MTNLYVFQTFAVLQNELAEGAEVIRSCESAAAIVLYTFTIVKRILCDLLFDQTHTKILQISNDGQNFETSQSIDATYA